MSTDSPFNRSSMTQRSPPPTPTPRTPGNQQQDLEGAMEVVSTSNIQSWLRSIEGFLNEVCNIANEGKLNSDQKLKISGLCRKVGHGTSQMAVEYQSLKQKALQTYSALQTQNEEKVLLKALNEVKLTLQESCKQPEAVSKSFADMVKSGSNRFLRPTPISSVSIFPSDTTKTSEDTKHLVQKIISPEDLKLKVRGVRKTRNGGVVISTETKEDLEKLKSSVQFASSGLSVDETNKRKPRITIIGVPSSMSENDVFKCIFEQNVAEKVPTLSRDSFMASAKLSHKSGRKGAETCNYVLEVSAVVRKALITQDRIFINWTSCPVRDFTLVTRCYNCQQYGHAAKTCKATSPTCGHCGVDGHSVKECQKNADPPKCASCLRFRKPGNHKTGDAECPARKAAEIRYINSVDYEGA